MLSVYGSYSPTAMRGVPETVCAVRPPAPLVLLRDVCGPRQVRQEACVVARPQTQGTTDIQGAISFSEPL